MSKVSPLAVSLPWKCGPYQEALPIWYQCLLPGLSFATTGIFAGELLVGGSAARFCAVKLGIANALTSMKVMNRCMYSPHRFLCGLGSNLNALVPGSYRSPPPYGRIL